ncbi:hypothetical protein BC936DRAFT_139046, partial [Jimgerdemannia flammicorona]
FILCKFEEQTLSPSSFENTIQPDKGSIIDGRSGSYLTHMLLTSGSEPKWEGRGWPLKLCHMDIIKFSFLSFFFCLPYPTISSLALSLPSFQIMTTFLAEDNRNETSWTTFESLPEGFRVFKRPYANDHRVTMTRSTAWTFSTIL